MRKLGWTKTNILYFISSKKRHDIILKKKLFNLTNEKKHKPNWKLN